MPRQIERGAKMENSDCGGAEGRNAAATMATMGRESEREMTP